MIPTRPVARRTLLVLAALTIAAPQLARAALRDRGPVDPATGFPAWYRDQTGEALELCLAQTPSPNASAGGAPMCFPWASDPNAFPGNVGDEQFWAVADALLDGPPGSNFSARLVTAVEAAYATGAPVRGEEIAFARIRIILDTGVPGTYRVTHPFGFEEFVDVPAGARAVAFTSDVGIGTLGFDGALRGAVGPFLRWAEPLGFDPVSNLPYALVTANGEEYLGDPNIPHEVTGSPFGTDFFRVDGPPGSGIGGPGVDFIMTPLFNVVGKRYPHPIPTRTTIGRAVYANDGDAIQIDVFAESAPAATLALSAGAAPTTALRTDGQGRFLGHVRIPATSAVPAEVVVTVTNDAPPSVFTAPLVDAVTIWSATYDVATGLLDVAAFSSDAVRDPALTLAVPAAGLLAPADGNPSLKLAQVVIGAPPLEVVVESAAGGARRELVKVVDTAPVGPQPPVAVADAFGVLEDTPARLPVLANDPAPGTVSVLNVPAHGTAVVVNGEILYTPAANYAGVDALTYTITDPETGLVSNAAAVSITVEPVNDAPVAVADLATAVLGTARTIAPAGNDTDPDGVVVAGTVAIVSVTGGTATVAGGLVTFTPTAIGTATITYTVQDDGGATSAPGTITVTVTGATEQLTLIRARFVVSTARYDVRVQSNVFGVNVASSATIYNGTTTSAPMLVTGVPFDATGVMQWQSTPGSQPLNAQNRLLIVSSGGGSLLATVQRK